MFIKFKSSEMESSLSWADLTFVSQLSILQISNFDIK